MTVAMLQTNGQGDGNAHISNLDVANAGLTGGPGTYYVVLKRVTQAPPGANDQFATEPVTIS